MSSRTFMTRIGLPKPDPFGNALVRKVAADAKPSDPSSTSRSAASVTVFGGVDSAVDRTWLGEVEHVLVREFQRPLGDVYDLIVTDPVNEGDAAEAGTETREGNCCQRAKQAVLNWRHCEQSGAPPGDEGESTMPQVVDSKLSEDVEAAEDRAIPTCKDASADALEDEARQPPWHGLDLEARTRMRHAWLKLVSVYFTELQAVFDETSQLANRYSSEVLTLQQRFLDFLQKSDDRGLILAETVKGWQARSAENSTDLQSDADQMDDLSERLWQFANERKTCAVRERSRLMDGSLWKEQAAAITGLAVRLQSIEHNRFQTSIGLLSEAFASSPAICNQSAHPGSPDGLSSLQEICDWLNGHTRHLAGGMVDIDEKSMQPGLANQLRTVLAQEQQGLVTRLCAVEEWASARLAVVREQLDEVFRRMDNWIRDRVRAENNAINTAMQQVRAENWSEVGALGASEVEQAPKTLRRSSSFLKVKKSMIGSAIQKRCARMVAALEADPLEVDIYKPPRPTQALSTQPVVDSDSARDCWTIGMLSDLMHGIVTRCGRTGTVDQESLLQELLARRNDSLSLRKLSVPLAWIRRSDDAFRALCRGFVVEEWGNMQIDVTEFLLALTFHSCRLPWPCLEDLRSARSTLEDAEQKTNDYLEGRLCKLEFMSLPLWDENEIVKARVQNEVQTCDAVAVQQWLFQLFLCFEENVDPRLDVNADPNQSVSTRRLFSYLGLGVMPTDGLQRAMALLMPGAAFTPHSSEEPRSEGTLRVQDFWRLIFSDCGRPVGAAAEAPSLADFCRDLLAPPTIEPRQEVTTEKEAPSRSKGKKMSMPEPAKSPDPVLDVPPEEAVVSLAEEELFRHPTVVRALASHGGLRCRRQVLDSLFPSEATEFPLVTSLKAAAAHGLESRVPPASTLVELSADLPG